MTRIKFIFSNLAIVSFSGWTSAQPLEGGSGYYEKYQLEIVLGVAALVCLVAVLALFVALFALKTFVSLESPKSVPQRVEKIGFWQKLWTQVNDAVPIEKEAAIMTSHEYDGIRELDNRLPPWWLYGFYFTILFGIGYLLNFHVFKTGDLQTAEYEKEMRVAKEQVDTYLASLENRIDESSVKLSTEEEDLKAGKQIYTANCLVCHGANGEGVVGPNFTDKYWLHGGDMASIFKTIKYGVTEKGMISWQSQLTPKQMQQVASFIYTLEGTNPPNPKDAQGQLFERDEDTKKESTEEAI